MQVHTTDASAVAGKVSLSGQFCIYNALESKESLLAALKSFSRLDLDLSQVEEMDSVGLQLLILLERESLRQGKTFRVCAASAPVLEVLSFYNMEHYFDGASNATAKGNPGEM